MFIKDNLVIYMKVKRNESITKRSHDAMKCILGGLLLGDTFDFCFCILNIFC